MKKILAFILIGLALTILIPRLTADPMKEYEPKPYQIAGKEESNGKCYVQVWIEITPEEYIGYDIGDEYKLEVGE